MQFGVLAEPLLDGKRLEQMARHGNLVHALPVGRPKPPGRANRPV